MPENWKVSCIYNIYAFTDQTKTKACFVLVHPSLSILTLLTEEGPLYLVCETGITGYIKTKTKLPTFSFILR